MQILGIILVGIVILAIVGGVFSLFIFLLPFILGFALLGLVVAGVIFILYIIFQVVKNPVSIEKTSEGQVEQQEAESVINDNDSIQLDDEIDISVDSNDYLEDEKQ
ncbi:MAG: hypothetical protein UW27_C0011G0002 [Parcubacteria group bacterium GW2011_GWA1_44_13]|uniref:Uncharacterized protein n=1 Tax=Candidatus Nomurabacteria bacterium GW2011_GWB1_44_12 TaxID=1618748 RepID=A0A837IAY3_9BACT|nr:MAG: hypothetical protein UW17_C0004G0011 [Candidatus Nomurabacteria bacterium GW2011_GWD1_44_10]KKT36445.1 MAG: hypothetical protein UW25_C0007G0002 [Candidatus Nomurabacteria bacterium GW2011_GWB1_44_12]KKT37680.1 MAG: hypothetical protein UW27_C0011G0002 [Parcubacteria group bacterium GW2011_GWA1_44_13]HBB44206.1 hypothetical protein [Candidatus Yonathbacteria bacterium]